MPGVMVVGTQMNDAYIDTHNPIFEIIQEEDNRQGHNHIIKGRIRPTQQALGSETNN
jgi:hypothetical protein